MDLRLKPGIVVPEDDEDSAAKTNSVETDDLLHAGVDGRVRCHSVSWRSGGCIGGTAYSGMAAHRGNRCVEFGAAGAPAARGIAAGKSQDRQLAASTKSRP